MVVVVKRLLTLATPLVIWFGMARTCAYGMGLLGWLLDLAACYIQKADMGTVTNTAGDDAAG